MTRCWSWAWASWLDIAMPFSRISQCGEHRPAGQMDAVTRPSGTWRWLRGLCSIERVSGPARFGTKNPFKVLAMLMTGCYKAPKPGLTKEKA